MSKSSAAVKASLAAPITEQDHIQGPADAPVTLVEYGDYQCPHCRLVYRNVRDLQEYLGDRMRYVYRHLPVEASHPHAHFAAEAAEAAGAQGRFWEMHDWLFTSTNIDRDDIYRQAEAMGLDMERFRSELETGVHKVRVQEDFDSGIRSGVNGTPTFYLNGERYDGAWDLESLMELVERPLGVRVRLLSQKFTQIAASGGIVLLICTIIALLWRNSPWGESYVQLWETHFTITMGSWSIDESLLHWINDGLMVIFFFVVGLEIKREVTSGELASRRKAALPLAGAIGGMLVPAAAYLAFNLGGPGEPGWGIPVATDIAFTLGILTVLRQRIPLSLKVFFTALAIADDLGAILVIAVFYTEEISLISLGVAAVVLLALIGLNRARVYSPIPYAVLGIVLWVAFLRSGVHPTIAGVLLAMTIPSRSPANMRALLAQAVTLLQSFELPVSWREQVDSRRQAAVSVMEDITERMQSPAQRLEEGLIPWTDYLILPLFALANAGILITPGSLGTLTSPISLGILLGLVVGKPLGITIFAWAATRLGLAELPSGVSWLQFVGATCLAGIGFTMSLFIADAAFGEEPELLAITKLAIIVASVLAAVIGSTILLRSAPGDSTPRVSSVASGD